MKMSLCCGLVTKKTGQKVRDVIFSSHNSLWQTFLQLAYLWRVLFSCQLRGPHRGSVFQGLLSCKKADLLKQQQ